MRTHTQSIQNVLLTLYDIHLTLLIFFFFSLLSLIFSQSSTSGRRESRKELEGLFRQLSPIRTNTSSLSLCSAAALSKTDAPVGQLRSAEACEWVLRWQRACRPPTPTPPPIPFDCTKDFLSRYNPHSLIHSLNSQAESQRRGLSKGKTANHI